MTELIYGLLKITSMLATGAFAALALLTRYKDTEGKITKWGRVALGGVLVSSGFSLSLYLLETSRANASAKKAKDQAEATASVLADILEKARATTAQLDVSLKETNLLKKGMDSSLKQQKSVLDSNKRILDGVTTAVNEQKKQLQTMARLDLSRSQVSALKISLKPSSKAAQILVNFLSEALVIDLPKTDQNGRIIIDEKGDPLMEEQLLPPVRDCFDENQFKVQCSLQIEEFSEDNIMIRVEYPAPNSRFGTTGSLTTQVGDTSSWSSVKRSLLSTFGNLVMNSDVGESLFIINNDFPIKRMTITKSLIELEVKDPRIKLDQLYSRRITFDALAEDSHQLPPDIHIQSMDPRARWDQTFRLKWELLNRRRTLLKDESGGTLFAMEFFSGNHRLNIKFPELDALNRH